MTRNRFFSENPSVMREIHRKARDLAVEIHNAEAELIEHLTYVDRRRAYVWLGYKSLRGYCESGLRFSLTQSPRLTTLVRRQNWQRVQSEEDELAL